MTQVDRQVLQLDEEAVLKRYLGVTKPCPKCHKVMAILDGDPKGLYLWCFECELREEIRK